MYNKKNTHRINLDDFSQYVGLSNPPQCLAFMNIDDFDFTTLARANTSKLGTITTITLVSTRIKRKRSSMS
jgi:hypothetical protein